MQGLILINKPSGITSFKAVSTVKRLAHEKRVGHTGTLDPMATGVLPIFIGRATVLSNFLLNAKKRYTAEITLGIKTDTGDITGQVINKGEVNVNNFYITEVLNSFKGKQLQTPPMYSAIKKDGVRLYSLARQGVEVEREKREIEIYSISLLKALNGNKFTIDVSCSKGTYIRSLCDDIGARLNTAATLSALCRTETAEFGINECVDLDALNEQNIEQYVLSAERAVMHLRKVFVTEPQAVRFSNGGQLDLARLRTDFNLNGEILRVKQGDNFLGLGEVDLSKNQLNIKCLV